MTSTSVNGHTEQTRVSKCSCCPYGFHIDLGFVDFVENVANETNTATILHDRNGSERNSFNKISAEDSTTVNECSTTSQTIKRVPFSPLDSIFSDSLENVVSDFEEALNLRKGNSESTSRNQLSSAQKNKRNNGYLSDYDTAQIYSQSLPPRMSETSGEAMKRKHINRPEVMISSHNGYHTALGRTMSEIKSKHQNDEINDSLKKTLFTANGYRIEDIKNAGNRSFDFNSSHESEYSRSLYEQGKAHYLGSRTPDMPRRSFTLASSYNQYPSDTESVHQPQWRIRSNVERSSSAVDADGFASMKRRKADANTFRPDPKPKTIPPIPYPRNCSLFSERLRRERSSPPHLPLNFLPKTENSNPWNFSDKRTNIRNTTNDSIENNFEQSMNGDALAVNSNVIDKDINANRVCLKCNNLQKQLYNLSRRLQEVTDEMKSKAIEELRKKRKESVLVDKAVGSSFKILADATTETTKVERKETASDPLLVRVDNKRTSVSLSDQVQMHWYNDIAISPVPQPQLYSIGIATDEFPTSYRNDATNSSSQELLALGSSHSECYNGSSITDNYGCGSDAPSVMCDFSSMTDGVELVDSGTGSKQTIPLLRDSSSMTAPVTSHSRPIQTEHIGTRTICVSTSPIHMMNRGDDAPQTIRRDFCTVCDDLMVRKVVDASTEMDFELSDTKEKLCCSTVALQTEFELEQSEPRIINDTEIAESLWLIPSRDRKDAAVGNEDDIIEVLDITSESHDNKKNLREELRSDSDDEDTICVVEETLTDPEDIDFESSKSAEQLSLEQRVTDNLDIKNTNEEVIEPKASRLLGHARAVVVKKMLTEKSQPISFIRGAAITKSCRATTQKGDSLQYILDQHKTQGSSTPSTPQTTKGALKEKVNLKKDIIPSQIPLSKVPEPVPARIPRPKISKYIPGETVPQSPDEEAEIADRLTPLRSEMRALRTYSNGRAAPLSRTTQSMQNSLPRMSPPTYDTSKPIIFEESSSSSSDSEGSYDTNEASTTTQFELTPQLSEAIEILKKHFEKSDSVKPALLDWATKHAKHEWLKTAARKTASAIQVESFIDFLETASDDVLKFVVNLADPNENTALHYAISHGNFDVVSVLLDSRVCNLDRANKAGYTAVMLASLCDASDEVEAAVIHRLFQLGDVNAQAVQHGQTALMLAVSHGKINTTKLLIDCQADLNIQDEEGSTALMCAAEHGHKEIVKLLLVQRDIDASLSDCDSSTALSIAVENGHRDIGVLIYAHLNHSCKQNQQKTES
uniref:ANK_REP_REGION domain-containing protein n=1 Tax=Setaria digitata TaxID=48799 RepID=A0A915Q863_9BILA